MRSIHFNYPARILVTVHTYVIICMAIKIQNVQELLKRNLVSAGNAFPPHFLSRATTDLLFVTMD